MSVTLNGPAVAQSSVSGGGNITGNDSWITASTDASALMIRRAPTGALALGDAIQSPLSLPNLAAWYAADVGAIKADHTQATTTGDAVALLVDLSGNQRHATPASGTPTYEASAFRGKPGVVGRFATPAFVGAGYGNAITVVCIRKSAVGAGLRIAIYIPGQIWDGYNTTNSTRDHSVSGLTGTSGNTVGTASSDSYGVIAVGTNKFRSMMGGIGVNSMSSASTTEITFTSGSVPFSNAVVYIGGYSNSSFDWGSAISETMVFNGYLTDSEMRQLIGYASRKYESAPLVVCCGNSLVSGSGSTGGATQAVSVSGTNYPSRLLALANGAYRVITDAFPGRTTKQMLDALGTYSTIFSDGVPAAYVVFEGSNDLATYAAPAGAYENLANYCRRIRTPNAKVVICTVLPRGDSGNDARNAAYTAQLNALIRENYSEFADALVDLAADTRLSNYSNTTYFNADKTHCTDAGYQVIADLVEPIVSALFA